MNTATLINIMNNAKLMVNACKDITKSADAINKSTKGKADKILSAAEKQVNKLGNGANEDQTAALSKRSRNIRAIVSLTKDLQQFTLNFNNQLSFYLLDYANFLCGVSEKTMKAFK